MRRRNERAENTALFCSRSLLIKHSSQDVPAFGHGVRNLRPPALAVVAVRLHTDSVFQRWQSTWCRRMPNAAPVCVAAVENPRTPRLKLAGIFGHTVQGMLACYVVDLFASTSNESADQTLKIVNFHGGTSKAEK